MSDVATAAPAPAPQAPAANEVPINPNPVSRPNPVGSQAPNKPVGDFESSTHHAESRRDSIRKAFQRAEQAEPARPKMGHNNPPEQMKREPSAREVREAKPKPEPVDLKKRPVDQPPRERGEHGHFAARENNQAPAAQPRPQSVQQLPDNAPYRDAPQRMSERARAEWHGTPESVRGEVHRMHHEFDRAYQQ